MAGDSLTINVEGLYTPPVGGGAGQVVAGLVQTFITAFTAPMTIIGEAGSGAAAGTGTTDLANAILNMQQSTADTNSPNAFLNYVLFDENMNLIPGGSGAVQLSSSATTWQALPTQTVVVPQNGFLRVFTSNTSTADVRFDNTQIVYWQGQLLEEFNYYPYGLIFDQNQVFSNIPKTNYLYNGKELQQNEFGIGGNGLELSDYGARMYDAQIGKWDGVDQLAMKYASISPYSYLVDNPINGVDLDGRDIVPSDDFNNSVYKAVEENLTSNSIYNKYTLPFKVNHDVNYNLNYAPLVAYSNDNAYTNGRFDSPGTAETTFNSDVKDETNQSVNKERSEIALARTEIHEAIHAWLINKNNLGEHHEYMASNLRGDIVKGLREYAKKNNISGLTEQNFQDLSWVGLTGTKAFNNTFKTEGERKAWQARTDKIEYKQDPDAARDKKLDDIEQNGSTK